VDGVEKLDRFASVIEEPSTFGTNNILIVMNPMRFKNTVIKTNSSVTSTPSAISGLAHHFPFP
jgi:hypothetical protein